MNRKRIRLLAAATVLAVLSLACSVGGPAAQIRCDPNGQQYDCVVTHTTGGAGQVCWDLRATCVNGTMTTVNSCVDITPGQSVTHTVPTSTFPNVAACDQISRIDVLNTTSTAN